MKRFFLTLFAALLLAGALTGCKAKKEEIQAPAPAPVAAPAPQYEAWEYQTVTLGCEVDRQTSSLVCYNPRDNDLIIADRFLATQGAQGWELVQILDTAGNQTFVFKRATLQVEAAETTP